MSQLTRKQRRQLWWTTSRSADNLRIAFVVAFVMLPFFTGAIEALLIRIGWMRAQDAGIGILAALLVTLVMIWIMRRWDRQDLL